MGPFHRPELRGVHLLQKLKKDKILLSHGTTGVRRVQISNKIDRSTYFGLIKGVTTIERSVTSRYHGAKCLDHKNGDLKQRRRWPQRERRKIRRFILAKWHLCTCITLFCGRCMTATWNLIMSRACFMKSVITTQTFSFSSFYTQIRSCRIQPQKISPTFDKLYEIE